VEAVVGGDRVDEPVGADLIRVVDPNRHPGLDPRTDRETGGVEVALGHRFVLVPEWRHDRGHRHRVYRLELEPAEGEEAGDPLGELVAGRPGTGLKSPMLGERAVLERAEMRLGVADIDREQHVPAIIAGTTRRDPPLRVRSRRVRARYGTAGM
jgi:hypothetical protein